MGHNPFKYRVCSITDYLDEYDSGYKSPLLPLVMCDHANTDMNIGSLTVPEKTSLFDGWDDFPFGSNEQAETVVQSPEWSSGGG